jgi:uncharacterized protein
MYSIKYLKIFIISFLLFTSHTGVFAGGPKGEIVKPTDRFLNPSDVKVNGLLGNAISLSERGRMLSLPGWNDGTLITMFSPEARKKNNTTDWYGEHAGKWLYSATLAANRTNNDNLKSLLFKTADYLINTQEADGYLGSYSEQLRITNNNSKQHRKSWDVWALSYMTLGLLQLNEYYPNAKYLDAAKKIGELFLKTFGDGHNDLTNYGTRYGISATIALEPVVELYKKTSDTRYLEFAKLIVKEMEQREGLRLITAGLNNRDMETVADGKAYQIIWNLLGVLKFYTVIGNPDYLKAVQNAWQNIYDYHLTITGGPWGGIGKHKECFNTKGFWDPYGFVETCSTMSWIQLNKELLRVTGEARYAQEIEKSTYNSLLGAQLSNGQDWSYHSFTNGSKHVANYNDCCPSSGMLALEELSPMIYSRKGNGIALNLFTENQATILLDNTEVNLSQKTSYPSDGKIRLLVTPSKNTSFPLYIRIPSWAQNTTISVDGKRINSADIQPGNYYTINRNWEKQTIVEINFPIQLQVINKQEVAIAPQSTKEIYKVSWIALARGPLVYAAKGLINGKDRETNLGLSAENARKLVKPLASRIDTAPTYQLKVEGLKPIVFVPYYEADDKKVGNWRLTWLQNNIE